MTASIRIERSLTVPVARVWEAWTQPEVLDDWFCPNPELEVSAHADAREGGHYRVNMGGEYIVAGDYVRVEEPTVLECTWSWEHETLTSVLLVELTPDPDGRARTDLVLVHSGLDSEQEAADLGQGWELSLDRLAALLAG